MTAVANLTSNAGSAATSFATASVAPTGNRLILVSVHAYISTGSVQPSTPTVTGNGITYTLVRAQDVDTSGTDRATEWLFCGLATSPSSGAITISFGAVTMTRCAWSVDQTDADIDLSSGIGTSKTNGQAAIAQVVGATSAGSTSLSVNYSPSMRSDSAGYSCWGHQTQEVKTPRASWTELSDVTSVSLATMEAQWFSGTDTAASASWVTSGRAGGIAIEIKKAAPVIWIGCYGLQGGTTGLTMVPPAGTQAGDIEVMWVANKNSSVDPTDPTGTAGIWIRGDSFEVGTGADGVGTGKVRFTCWWRILTGTSTNTTITITGANRSIGGGQVYRLTAGGSWATPVVTFGSDTDSSTTAFAAAMAVDLAAKVDDYVLSIGAFTANTTLPGRSLTVPNWSHSRLDNIDSAGGATGNQIFCWTDQRTGMIGTQSGVSTTGATSGVGTTGGAMQVKVAKGSAQIVAIGQAGSQATGGAIGHAKAATVGQATSAATATAVTHSKARTVGQAVSTSTGQPIHAANTRLAGRATEADTGTTATRRKALGVSRAVETSTGTLVTPRRAKPVQAATEADTAGVVAKRKAKTVGQATELATAGAIARRKTRPLGQAAETDTAGPVVRPGQVGRALEIATAGALAKSKTRAVARATETATATTLARSKLAGIGRALETGTATAVAHGKAKVVARATEAATAAVIARGKRRVAGVATEIDTGGVTKTPGQLAILGKALESDGSGSLAVRRVIPRPTGAVVTVPGGVIPRPTGAVVPRP